MQLLNYTYTKTQKPKSKTDEKAGGCFPHSAMRLANQIWDLTFYGDSLINQANDYITHSAADYKVRREMQLRGRGYFMHIPRLIRLAYEQGFIPKDNLEFWAGIIYNLLELLGGWIRSDEKRFSSLK